MNKNRNQPKAVPGTAMAKIEKPVELKILPPTERTHEDIEAENEQLKKMLERQNMTLDEKINYYREKEEFVKQYKKLMAQRDSFLSVLDEIGQKVEENEFINDVFSIAITQKRGYSQDESVFKSQNPLLVGELLRYVLNKMSDKVEELQISISA